MAASTAARAVSDKAEGHWEANPDADGQPLQKGGLEKCEPGDLDDSLIHVEKRRAGAEKPVRGASIPPQQVHIERPLLPVLAR